MNKRILSLLAVVAVLMAMFAFTTTASAYYRVYSACPNGKPLNIREGPGKDYAVIGSYSYGAEIYVIGETYPGWLQLNDYGFVQASMTTSYNPGPYVPPTPRPQPQPTPKNTEPSLNKIFDTARTVKPYIITLKATQKSKNRANVRWAPLKTATLLRAYEEGTEMKVIAELDKWYQVEDLETGEVGFVNTAYVVK